MSSRLPRRFGFVLFAAFVTAIASVSARAQTVITNLANTNDGSSSFDSSKFAGLQFHTGSGSSWDLSQVILTLGGPVRWAPTGSGGILYSLDLYSSAAGVPVALLAAIGTYNFTDEGAWSANAAFTPTAPISLQSNTDYWLVLSATTGRPGGIWESTSSSAFVSGAGFSFGPSVFTPTNDVANVTHITGFTHFAAIAATPSAIPEPAVTSASLAVLVMLFAATWRRKLHPPASPCPQNRAAP